MEYTKSGGQEIGMVIKHHKWVEGMDIRYWRSDIGVGMGSNIGVLGAHIVFSSHKSSYMCVKL